MAKRAETYTQLVLGVSDWSSYTVVRPKACGDVNRSAWNILLGPCSCSLKNRPRSLRRHDYGIGGLSTRMAGMRPVIPRTWPRLSMSGAANGFDAGSMRHCKSKMRVSRAPPNLSRAARRGDVSGYDKS